MAAHKSAIAKVKTFIKYLPEFIHILSGGKSNINKVKSYNALIETTIVFRLAVFINIRSKEAAAAHAGVAVTLAVLVNLKVEHYLFTDIVGNHALCRTFCSKLGKVEILASLVNVILFKNINKLGECRSYPHICLVLHALIALAEHFLNNKSKVMLLLGTFCFVKVHEYCKEGSLSVCGHKRNYLILHGLYAFFNLLAKALLNYLGDMLFISVAAQKIYLVNDLCTDLLS